MLARRISSKLFVNMDGRGAIAGTALCLLLVGGCKLPAESEVGSIGESYVHTRASWSTDGKWISFTASIQGVLGIYLVDSSGASLRLLIQRDAVGTTWSPDGKWLAFSSLGSLYQIKVGGDSLSRLTTSIGDIRPAWSRDGSKICFVRRESPGTGTIQIYDFRTGSASRLLSFGDFPSWHPNGKEIIILEAQFDATVLSYVYKFTAASIENDALRTLITFSSRAECGFSSISPKENEILYSLKTENDYAQVWKFELGAGRHTRLTEDGGDYPAWSPDGNRIVYTRTQSGDGGLWTMNADGTGKRRLTSP